MYEGVLNGSRVYVKRIRVYSKDGSNDARKAGHPTHPRLPLLTSLAGPLSRGCGVEALDPPKHRPHPRYHHGTFQLVSDWVPGWNLTGFVKEHPVVSRLGLVGIPNAPGLNDGFTPSQAI